MKKTLVKRGGEENGTKVGGFVLWFGSAERRLGQKGDHLNNGTRGGGMPSIGHLIARRHLPDASTIWAASQRSCSSMYGTVIEWVVQPDDWEEREL
eukprot:1158485-Pelagomonas_calceolata.AAC.5